eukprot:comp17709_c0_seq1/m.17605 comp17709_c0_seq1/g.17605  ORF comp17709_c0_seq1/g.17605 comp17709_c0_seq1/m.17605 type:complete len:205 (-) comp17709_c0_seq1:562-1176(-)
MEAQKTKITVNFMPVPPIYQLYTDEAVESGTAPPPPPIPEDEYTVYGETFSTKEEPILPWKQKLEAENWMQVFPDKIADLKGELRKIAMSLLFTFMDLVNALVETPSDWPRYHLELCILLQNFTALINEYRPHQARETLKAMLEAQMKRRHDMAEKLQRCTNAVNTELQGCLSDVFPKVDSAMEEYTNQMAALEAEMHQIDEDW